MWIEAARMYIPGADKFSDEKVDGVNIPYCHQFSISRSYVQVASTWSLLKRSRYPEDIAPVVGFLCSEDAGWVNGQIIQILVRDCHVTPFTVDWPKVLDPSSNVGDCASGFWISVKRPAFVGSGFHGHVLDII